MYEGDARLCSSMGRPNWVLGLRFFDVRRRFEVGRSRQRAQSEAIEMNRRPSTSFLKATEHQHKVLEIASENAHRNERIVNADRRDVGHLLASVAPKGGQDARVAISNWKGSPEAEVREQVGRGERGHDVRLERIEPTVPWSRTRTLAPSHPQRTPRKDSQIALAPWLSNVAATSSTRQPPSIHPSPLNQGSDSLSLIPCLTLDFISVVPPVVPGLVLVRLPSRSMLPSISSSSIEKIRTPDVTPWNSQPCASRLLVIPAEPLEPGGGEVAWSARTDRVWSAC